MKFKGTMARAKFLILSLNKMRYLEFIYV